MKRINKKIEKQYEIARQMAVDEMIRLARKILKEHPHLDEFIIAMGSCFFTLKDKSGSVYDNHISMREQYMKDDYSYSTRLTYQYFKPLDEFIGEWDDVFKLTGEGVRFKAEGKIITDW